MKLMKFTTYDSFVKSLIAVVVVTVSLLTVWGSLAQSESITVTQTAEQDIGFKCPVSSTFNPEMSRLWVLMDNCRTRRFSLHAFDAPDWSPVTLETGDFSEPLAIMDNVFILEYSAMAFTPDGLLEIRYQDGNTSENVSLAVNTTTGTVEASADAFILSEESMDALIPGFDGYPEFAVYNADHTVAAVSSDSATYIIDLSTGALMFDIQYEGYSGIASFSSDGSTLYMADLNNPDDYTDYSATLVSYSLPDGERGEGVPVPSFLVWVSPDGTQAVSLIGEAGDALAVVDLTTGEVSPPVGIFEAPQRLLNCLNRNGDLSDFNTMSRGELYVTGLKWLPDSTGFVTVNSYLGDSGPGTRLCALNFSRLREYSVESGT